MNLLQFSNADFIIQDYYNTYNNSPMKYSHIDSTMVGE